MECAVPLHKVELGSVLLGSVSRSPKPLLPLAYSPGAEIHMPSFEVLLPPLPVKAYDASTGRLDLSLLKTPAGTTQKLQALQEFLFQWVVKHHRGWAFTEKGFELGELREGFQPFVDAGNLHLYCPQTSSTSPDMALLERGIWRRGAPASLAPGSVVRLLVRLQGLSFHLVPSSGAWTGKFRLQHRIVAMMLATA